LSVNALVDYAVTRDQVLRLGYQQSHNSQANLGVGAYDLPERAYSAAASEHRLRFQEAGPIGRRFFASTQLQIRWRD
jgi:hypothetical protein